MFLKNSFRLFSYSTVHRPPYAFWIYTWLLFAHLLGI